MKKAAFVLVLVIATAFLVGCGQQTNLLKNQKEGVIPPPLDYRSYTEIWYDKVTSGYSESLPYESTYPLNEATQLEIDAIPVRFEKYKEKFEVDFESGDSEFTEELVSEAISDSAEERHAVAGREDCPIELLVKIAKDEPDRAVRFRAEGNILSRDVDEKYLLELTKSQYADARLTAIMHDDCTESVVAELQYDSDTFVRQQYDAFQQQP